MGINENVSVRKTSDRDGEILAERGNVKEIKCVCVKREKMDEVENCAFYQKNMKIKLVPFCRY